MTAVLSNESFLMLLAINMVAAVGMNLVYVTGQLNLGQAGFLAVGAYTLAVLDAGYGWPLPLSLAAGALAAAVVAFPVALGANRVRGIYLIMGTLAVGEVVRVAISNVEAVGGLQGFSGQSPISLTAVVATLAVVLALAALVMASPLGLRMRSIFDDEDAAASAGVATRRIKILAVVISAATVAVAGGLLAKFFLFIAPRNFGVIVSFQIALFTLIGGVHSLLGALAGAFFVTYLLEFLRISQDVSWMPSSLAFLTGWRIVVYGVLVMVIMAALPDGLVSRRLALRLTAPWRWLLRGRSRAADRGGPRVLQAPPDPSVVELEGISHRFGGLVALQEVSFGVREGEILALIGANGAGKTTLIDVVAGRHRCQAGSMRLRGEDLAGLRPERRVRAGVSRTFQSVRMLGHLTVDECLRLGRLAAGGRAAASVEELLDLIGLADRRDALPGALSLADQRRLEIGRAFASAPRVIFLDEPSVGMNEEERAELGELVQALRDRGSSVVLVDHNLDLALGMADRVVVLDFGRVLAVGSPDEVFEDPRVREAYLGSAEVVPGKVVS